MKKLETAPVADRVATVATMSTAELVAWYNEHAEVPVKKFSDRKTAERRVLALLAPMAVAAPAKEPKAVTVKKEPIDRSKAVADTWLDADVAAARAARDHVLVDGQWFVSVRQAFIDFDLPLKEHVRFRMKLKREQELDAYGLNWAITKDGPKEN